MNPVEAIMGGSGAVGGGMMNMPSAPVNGGFGGILGRAQQLAGMLQNPANLVRQYFPDAPAEVSGNPDSLLGWMQQTGRVNPQAVQMVRQMIGRG